MIKWIDSDKYWPGKEPKKVIVKAWTLVTLSEEYNFKDHDESMIGLNFYALIYFPRPYSGDFGDRIPLNCALIYELEIDCCEEKEKKEHQRHLEKIGCYHGNIEKFISKKNLDFSLDSMSHWAYLEDEE